VPHYRFTIRDTGHFDGIMPDDGTAREHAIKIMGELQKHDEAGWTGHMMEVTRERRVVWRIPFLPRSLRVFYSVPKTR
jgi:hypothetical protein